MDVEKNVIEARDLLKQNSILLIDVRSQEQFLKKNVPNSINIPFSRISQEIPKMDTKRAVLLICNDGALSIQALKILEACGFKAHVVRGGLKDWEQIIGL